MPDYRQEARRAARRYGLDPRIFERQIGAESGFNPSARSPAGALGIAQIIPSTARGWGVNPLDPLAALDAAAKNMAAYVKRYGGYEPALRAYNAGPGAIERSKGYAETNAYVKKILGGQNPAGLASPRPPAGSPYPARGATPVAPRATPGLADPGSAGDVTSLLSSLMSQPEPPPAPMAIPVPALAAAPRMPAGFAPITPMPAEPAPAQDRVGAALGLLGSLGGADSAQGPSGAVEGAEGPGAPPIVRAVVQERAKGIQLPESGENPWGVLDHVGRSGLYIQKRYGVKEIGGYRASDPYPDHPSRKALDFMTYDDTARGEAIARDLIRNHKQHGVRYVIWNQRIWKPGEGWKAMADRGSPTQNHEDHVHVLYR